MAKVAGLFPGQGSQTVGMGKAFIESSKQAKAIFEEADDSLGFSLSSLCLEGPIEELTLTKYAQPAILTVSYISFIETRATIDAAAGHSLGEYSALVAAGSISFAQAVELVHKRGCYMQEAVAPGAGKMVAIMGPTEAEIQGIIDEVDIGVKEIANLNSPGQTVVAGDVAGVDAFSEKMKEQGAKVIPLQVSAPFHCSLMKPAADKLALDLDAITFNDPSFPVYCNSQARAVTTGAEARECLKEQVCASVRWTDSMNNMIEEQNIERVIEFGAGGVLSKLMKRINKDIARSEVFDPESAKTISDLAKN